MRFKNKHRVFYIQLEEYTFQRLKHEVSQNNRSYPKGDKHLKLDIACFFINLIDKRKTLLGEEIDDGFVPLMSSILKNYYYDYKRYITFLKNKEFIEVRDGYSTFKGLSKQYKVIPSQKPFRLIQYLPEDFVFSKKVMGIENKERIRADKTCKHLTKWLHPQFLSIRDTEANNLVDELMRIGYYGHGHFEKRKQKIDLLAKGYISYKREGKDNRLHSILTNMPKDLRPFLLFEQEKQLISLDLKSSQPFMLAGLMNLVIGGEDANIGIAVSKIVGSKRRKGIGSIINMWKENLSPSDIADFRVYMKIVLEDDIYDYIGRNLSAEFIKKNFRFGRYSDKFYSKYSKRKKWKSFDSKRDFSKVTFLEYLYSSGNNNEERIKEVKRILPKAVSKFITSLKKHHKRDFPIFLQNLESFLIIDEITKKFAKKYPNVPLYTIHDSVATTEEYVNLIKEAMEQELLEFFGIKPNIIPEKWMEDHSEAA